MAHNGQDDHFGQNGLIPNWILAFARPKWSKMVHFGLESSILVHLVRILYDKQICITYSFTVESFSFVCWAGPTGRELPNKFPYLGVPEYSR